jgi:hypothetical protein
MTTSVLLGNRPNRHALSIRAAMVAVASACVLGCTGDEIRTVAPRAAPVFTSVVITTDSGNTSTRVGDTLGVSVVAVDQYGAIMGVDTVYQAVSDTTRASIVYALASPWDYGDSEFIVGTRPGEIVLTATATLRGVSHSATKSITILAADSSP